MATSTPHRRLVAVWVGPETLEALDEAARQADRSRSAELRIALRRHLAEHPNLETHHVTTIQTRSRRIDPNTAKQVRLDAHRIVDEDKLDAARRLAPQAQRSEFKVKGRIWIDRATGHHYREYTADVWGAPNRDQLGISMFIVENDRIHWLRPRGHKDVERSVHVSTTPSRAMKKG